VQARTGRQARVSDGYSYHWTTCRSSAFQVERMPSSGRMCWEYAAVYGCARALTAAVVAVTVAVGDTGGPSAPEAGSQPFAIAMGERRCSDLS